MTSAWHPRFDTLERTAPAAGRGRQALMDSLMDQITDRSTLEREPLDVPARPRRRTWRTPAIVAVAVLVLVALYFGFGTHGGNQAVALASPAMPVTVSEPLQREVDTRVG